MWATDADQKSAKLYAQLRRGSRTSVNSSDTSTDRASRTSHDSVNVEPKQDEPIGKSLEKKVKELERKAAKLARERRRSPARSKDHFDYDVLVDLDDLLGFKSKPIQVLYRKFTATEQAAAIKIQALARGVEGRSLAAQEQAALRLIEDTEGKLRNPPVEPFRFAGVTRIPLMQPQILERQETVDKVAQSYWSKLDSILLMEVADTNVEPNCCFVCSPESESSNMQTGAGSRLGAAHMGREPSYMGRESSGLRAVPAGEEADPTNLDNQGSS